MSGFLDRDPVEIDESFSDIIQDFKFGGKIVTELHNGTWGILNEVMYAKTESKGSATRAILGVPTTLTASVESTSFTGTLLGEYRAVSAPTGTLDLMAGARIWHIDNDIDLSLTAGGPRLAGFSGSDGATWVDPMRQGALRHQRDLVRERLGHDRRLRRRLPGNLGSAGRGRNRVKRARLLCPGLSGAGRRLRQ
jgi:hypothetical protein